MLMERGYHIIIPNVDGMGLGTSFTQSYKNKTPTSSRLSIELEAIYQENLISCVSSSMAKGLLPIGALLVTVYSEIKLTKVLYMTTRSSHTKRIELSCIKETIIILLPLYGSTALGR